ncbi:MAG TPA: S-layer homology domain-containing protein, partial [Chloroflexia bacterium]|nr:S-layer homology domain-containing protein [Chloroflexia bacterium]
SGQPPTNTPPPAATSTATAPPPPTTTPPTNTATPAASATRTAAPTNTVGPSATPCPLSFTDVHATDYFYTPVLYLACHGVISGYANGDGTFSFRPYNNTTRSQMVKIVVLGFAKPIVTPAGGNYTFADVPPSNPFFSVVETAAAATIVSGYNCGGPNEPCDSANRPYFRPYANVTRGQLSKIDVVAAGWSLRNPPLGSFTDVLPGTAFYEFVETAYCHGVISGYTCGGVGEPCDSTNRPYFRQYNQATRGQIAKIVDLSITGSSSCGGPGGTR